MLQYNFIKILTYLQSFTITDSYLQKFMILSHASNSIQCVIHVTLCLLSTQKGLWIDLHRNCSCRVSCCDSPRSSFKTSCLTTWWWIIWRYNCMNFALEDWYSVCWGCPWRLTKARIIHIKTDIYHINICSPRNSRFTK